MTLEERLERLYQGAAESWMGDHEASMQFIELRAGIAKLRDRIDELGGYHNDI